ncbi:MAG: ParB/RepB/Spo0J family partition protein [Pseudooceanicola nanhaiensis]
MSGKRRIFDIELPDEVPVGKTPDRVLKRRGPMASAISENAGALRERQQAEETIRAENDRLAEEFVKLKREGLIVDRIPLDKIVSERLVRDRSPGPDPELEELMSSISDIGLSNPIRVEARPDGRFDLVQGMRRLNAFRALKEQWGGNAYDTIPAGIEPVEPQAEKAYRRMVDENLIRKNISFAEMATLARAYADDPENGCADVSDAVAVLFKSASYVKRSYIRAFAELLARLDGMLDHPHDLPRNLGVDLKRKLDQEPEIVTRIGEALAAKPGRTAPQEVEILRGFLGQGEQTLPTGKVSSESAAKPRQAKTTFEVPLSAGVAKCNASQGRLELKSNRDFSSIDRRKLERAVAAFFRELGEE